MDEWTTCASCGDEVHVDEAIVCGDCGDAHCQQCMQPPERDLCRECAEGLV